VLKSAGTGELGSVDLPILGKVTGRMRGELGVELMLVYYSQCPCW